MTYSRLNLHWMNIVAAFFIHLNQNISWLNKETPRKRTKQRICSKDERKSIECDAY